MTLSVIGNLAIAAFLLFFLYRLQQKHVSFTRRVFAGLGLGILFGAALQLLYGFFNDTATTEIYTLHIVGSVRCV